MPANFPGSLDTYVNPGATNSQDQTQVLHHVQHANINDAMTAVQSKIGIDGATDTKCLDFKVSQLQSNRAGTGFSGTNVSGTVDTNGISLSVNPGGGGGGFVIQGSGTYTQNTGTVQFSNANGVTFGLTAGTMTASVAAQSNQTLGLYGSGNTSGTSSATVDARSHTFSAAGSLTVDMSGGTIRLSAPNALTIQSNQTMGLYGLGNTSGTSTATVDARSWSLSAAGSLTVDMSGGTVRLSAPNALTTAALSGDTSKYVQAWELDGNNTAGTTSSLQGTKIYFSGGNNITLSGNSNTIVVSAAAAAAGAVTNLAGGNTSGTSSGTFQSTLSVNASGAMTVAASNNGFNLSVPATSSLSASGWVQISSNGSTISIGATTTADIYLVGNTANSSSLSYDLRTLSINFTGSITGAITNGSLQISAPNAITTARASTDAVGLNTAQTNVTWTVNSSGISINASGYAGTVTGGTNCSVTANSNGVSVNVPQYTNSFFEPEQWNAAGQSATSTGTLSNLHVQPFTLHNYLSFNAVNLAGSASMFTTSTGNTLTVSVNSNGSFGLTNSYSYSLSNYIDLFLFTRGSGSYSDELFTIASTRNTVITLVSAVYRASATVAANSTWSCTLNWSVSESVSVPVITSGQAINGASSWTTWAPGYSTISTSSNTSASTTGSTNVTGSISVVSAGPYVTHSALSSNKLVPLPFGTSLTPGEYWLGMRRQSSSSSSSSSANNNVTAGNSYTIAFDASNLTFTGQLTFAGSTNSLANSLGWLTGGSQATLAPSPGHGSFSGTYDPASTYLNAAGQPNGAIGFSQISTGVSLFRSWFQMANNRI